MSGETQDDDDQHPSYYTIGDVRYPREPLSLRTIIELAFVAGVYAAEHEGQRFGAIDRRTLARNVAAQAWHQMIPRDLLDIPIRRQTPFN